MLRKRFDGKTIGTLVIMIMTVCLSAYASTRSADAWTLNPSDFRYDMTLYFSTSSKAYENLEAYEIGAFINDECRGLAENLELPEGYGCMYMRIRSNSTEAEEVVFKMREKATGEIVVLKGKDAASLLFKPNEMVGLPSDPYILTPYFSITIEAGENGTVEFSNGMYAQGTVIEVEALPAEGYHFEKWSDGSTEAKRSITVEGDLELSATFAVSSYKAVFSIDSTEVVNLTLPYGSKIEAPEAPEKEGYTFAGWKELPETMPAKDIEITGSYNVNYYKLTFVIDDTTIEEKEVAYGSEIIAPSTPDKEGHTFEGWLNFVPTMPAEDLTIFGSYKVNSHLLKYVIDGEIYEEHVVQYGAAITAPEAPEKEGYTFTGWENLPETMPAKDVEVTGKYRVNTYKIVFKIDGEVIETAEVDFGAAITAPNAPEKKGYTFAGWKELPKTMPAKDIEIAGSYNVNYYKLTFVIDDTTIEEKEVAYGSEIIAPSTPDNEGHTFEGWLNFVPTMPAEDLTIFGSYKVNSHLLKYVIDGEIYEEHVIQYGAAITAPEAPEKEGYTFTGWENLPETMPAKDVEVTGKYRVNTYKIVFKIDGEVIETAEVAFGTAITAPKSPEKEGYTFTGWENLPETMPAKDVEVTGWYRVNTYKIVFKIDGEVIETAEVAFGTAITAPEAPEKEGYTFTGWENMPETMPAKDVEVTGSYTVNYYTLTVYINGEVYMQENVAYGTEIIIPLPEAPENMEFEGWAEEIPETMPAHDVVINGTMVDSTSVDEIMFDKDEVLNIYNLNGVLLYKDVKPNELKERLAPGLYIINGKKVMIK